MYLDIKGLVTVAVGNLIDPLVAAIDLPFLHKDGTPASRPDIAAEWRMVKANTRLAKEGHLAAQAMTQLRLSPAGITRVVLQKLSANEARLLARFPKFLDWPAAAQMGLLSMAWAAGPAMTFPKFEAAAKVQDWTTCAEECHLDDRHNAGLKPRNSANKALFLFAQYGCPDELP